MAIQLSSELQVLLNDRKVYKALATVDEAGIPDVVLKHSIFTGEDGNIHYLELLESSRTNHNLVRAIWFDQTVSIAVTGPDKQRFQIKGRPVEVHITGPLFEEHYVEVRQALGDVELSGVWVIEPLEVIDENISFRRKEEDVNRPYFRHLDRLAKTPQK